MIKPVKGLSNTNICACIHVLRELMCIQFWVYSPFNQSINLIRQLVGPLNKSPDQIIQL